MSWQAGSTIFGVGLAILTMVVPMMEFAIPRWLLALLLLLGVLLVVAWPASLAAEWIADYKMRHVVFVAIGAVVGGLVFAFIGNTMLSIAGKPSSNSQQTKIEIDWKKLSGSLQEVSTEHSGVTLFYVSSRRPLVERLKSVFELAGWKTDFVPTPYDQFAPHWPYVEGIQVKGRNRVVVESVSERLRKAGARNVSAIVEENDGGAGPDHVNWKSISQRVTVVVGHANE